MSPLSLDSILTCKQRRLPAACTPAGNFKQLTRQQVFEWRSQAWYKIQDEIIIESFKKCGISNTLDCSEDSDI